MATNDPIVAEIHAFRRAFAARHDHDIERIFAAIKAQRIKSGRKTVKYPSRPASRKPSQRQLASLPRSRAENG